MKPTWGLNRKLFRLILYGHRVDRLLEYYEMLEGILQLANSFGTIIVMVGISDNVFVYLRIGIQTLQSTVKCVPFSL